MEKTLVILQQDFGEEWIAPLVNSGVTRVGLHVNPFDASVEAFLESLDGLRGVIDALEEKGIVTEYYLHVVGYLLPRVLFAETPALFRMDANGRRVDDYNGCPSNARTLDIIAEQAARLAARLGQRSHRYHLWQDDDLGGDISCRCVACKALTPSKQNLILAQAILRGLRAYDSEAEISLLVYGETDPDIEPQDGIFVEFAPFRRDHGRPMLCGEKNRAYRLRLEGLLKKFPADKIEVLEYFLSYDYAGFCRDGRVEQDMEYYRSLGIQRLSSFAVFPQEKYVQTHGFDGIYKFFAI